jgi:drug/metabolite transporter (DMT)-like permease
MSRLERPPVVPVLQALFVTFLWSSSWVLIKLGLAEIPALTFAGLRYCLAFLILAPFAALRPAHRRALRALSGRQWSELVALGLLFYTLTQGAMFVALAFLPAMPVSLVLSFSPALVALLGIPLLSELPSRLQWSGMALFLLGVLIYFAPFETPLRRAGVAAAVAALLTNSVSAVMGRSVNRRRNLHPLVVTVVSMAAGAAVLLALGLWRHGFPRLGWESWAIILYLAGVNTALAFTLWNHTLQRLSAVQSSIINNTMLIQIALLAWIFLREPLGWKATSGIGLAAAGALLVQLRRT